MVDAFVENLWFDFSEDPILPWSDTFIPVNMLVSILILTGLLYALIRKNEQTEEDEEVKVYESLKKMKWHLEEEILEEAKKLSREEELQRQRRSRSKSKSKSREAESSPSLSPSREKRIFSVKRKAKAGKKEKDV